jgi:hypothetical protein
MREEVFNNTQLFQEKMKKVFYKKTKGDDFKINDLVLKWGAKNEDKGKHGKFDHLWLGPYRIMAYHGNNVFSITGVEWIFPGWRSCQWKVSQTLCHIKHLDISLHYTYPFYFLICKCGKHSKEFEARGEGPKIFLSSFS